MEESALAANPIRYRGYIYDTETGFYYLQSRYYDPSMGRFINTDSMMMGTGSLQGYNLFAYCFNNPVNLTDENGNWPKWLKRAAKWVYDNVTAVVDNVVDAFVTLIEVQGGLGYGIGAEIDGVAGAEAYRDFYVGFDDGKTITGNVVSTELEVLNMSIGGTYTHVSEIDGVINYCSECYGIDIVNCSNSQVDSSVSYGLFSLNSDLELVIGPSASLHAILGGHVSAGFNVSEFIVRLFD